MKISGTWFALTLAILAIAGCVSGGEGQTASVPVSYELSRESGDGFVAFSVHLAQDEPPCDGAADTGDCDMLIFLSRGLENDFLALAGLDHLNPLALNVAGDEGLYGQAKHDPSNLVLLKLQSDSYEVWRWNAALFGQAIETIKPAYIFGFDVLPGEVTYAGRLYFQFNVAEGSGPIIHATPRNRSYEDLPRLLSAYPQFESSVRTDLFMRIPLRSATES